MSFQSDRLGKQLLFIVNFVTAYNLKAVFFFLYHFSKILDILLQYLLAHMSLKSVGGLQPPFPTPL